MRFLAAVGALGFFATISSVSAQVQIMAQTERSDFLLYERVDMLVTVANSSASDVVLDNDAGHPWLSFLVSKKNHMPVRPEREGAFKPITLKVGETKTLRINLTPLFAFREEGNYSAAAVIDLPGAGEVVSDPVPFSVLSGREIWHQERPVEGSQRVYSLIRFSPKPDTTNLYLRVEDPSENTVLANLSLGQLAAYVDPQVYFDPKGDLHVLQLISMSTYLYTRTDESGKVLHQAVFKTANLIRPQLAKMEDGSVTVVGGAEQDETSHRETLSQGQRKSSQMEKKPDAGDIGAPPVTDTPAVTSSPAGTDAAH